MSLITYSWKDETQGIVQKTETGTYEDLSSFTLADMEAKRETLRSRIVDLDTEIAEVKRTLVYAPMTHDELDAVAVDLDYTWSASGLTKDEKIEELIANS